METVPQVQRQVLDTKIPTTQEITEDEGDIDMTVNIPLVFISHRFLLHLSVRQVEFVRLVEYLAYAVYLQEGGAATSADTTTEVSYLVIFFDIAFLQ